MARPLTGGEIAMVRQLFGDAIDVARVRVHARRYLPFGMQPKHCAMAPNGSLYFHHSCFRDDFSRAAPCDQRWFMHEMVHVWQHQLGYMVRLRGAIRIGLHYTYALRPGANLADYNMEAQGDLLADYFMLRFGGAPGTAGALATAGHSSPPAPLALYDTVLASFLAHPRDCTNLPAGWGRAWARTLR